MNKVYFKPIITIVEIETENLLAESYDLENTGINVNYDETTTTENAWSKEHSGIWD